jgi:carboxyl-terminal processing protease
MIAPANGEASRVPMIHESIHHFTPLKSTGTPMPDPERPRPITRFGNWPVPVLCGLLAIQILVTIGAGRRDDLAWFDPIVDVRAMVLEDFVGEPDTAKMQEAAISGMLETLDDPYTVWIPPRLEKDFDKQMRGSYVGIGAEIEVVDDRLRIISPLEDSPSLDAGIRAGDVVLDIDETDTLGLSSQECIDLLIGVEGTPVTMLVRHLDGTEESLTVIRRQIETRSVKGIRRAGEGWDHMLDPNDGIGYIRLTQFTERTIEEMREALDGLDAAGTKAIILDLRFNGGGTLDGAIDVADLFLDRGVIVSVRDRNGDGRKWTATADADDHLIPIVVLVNDGSASASEIVAGALQDNNRAKILGERSFGKGSVQEVRPLPGDRGTLKMTTARYYLPNGRNLDRRGDDEIWGVDPDPGFVIDLDNAGYTRLVENRRRYEPITDETDRLDARFDDPTWIEQEIEDPQLAAALRTLQSKLTTGEWLKVGGDPGSDAVLASELLDQIAYRTRLLDELTKTTARIAELDESGAVEASAGFEIRDERGNVIGRVPDTEADRIGELLAGTAKAEPRKGDVDEP